MGRVVEPVVGDAAAAEQRRSLRRRLRWLLVPAALIAVAAAAMWPRAEEGITLTAELDGPAPGFELKNLRPGAPPVSLAAAGGRPVVLNVWASWCTPCRREMPALAAAHGTFGDRVAFIGINHQDTRDHAIALLDGTGVAYPSGYDPEGSVALDYGLFGMPTTISISADRELLERRTGEMTDAEIASTIRRLFAPG